MRRIVFIIILGVQWAMGAHAQTSTEAAFEKLMEVTKVFGTRASYSCNAILEVKYKNGRPLRDTSRLICKAGITWYRSPLAESVDGPSGEIMVNHELRTVSLYLSDSIRKILQMEMNIQPDKELESVLVKDVAAQDMAFFRNFLTRHCDVVSLQKDGLEELSFTPKDRSKATLLSFKIRFDKDSRVRYYEYTNRDVYARDPEGNSKFRLVRTIFDNFEYEQVPEIPSKFTDFLEWKGWSVKLKKYTNYKLSVL